MNQNKQLSKGAKIYIGSDIFYYTAIYFLDIFLASLLTLSITKGNLQTLGFVISYSFIIRAVVEFIAVKKINIKNNVQRKQLVIISSVLSGIMIIFLGFSTTVTQVILFYSVITIFSAVSYPYRWALFTSQFAKDTEDKAWAYEDIITSLCLGIFSAVTGIIASKIGLYAVFVFLGLSYMASGGLFYLIKTPKKFHLWFLR